MVVTGPYDPCPCGSGKKYRFCCRNAKETGEKEKQSAAMLEYIEPLLARTGDDEASVRDAVVLGLACWKLAESANGANIDGAVSVIAASMTRDNPSKLVECEELIKKMVFRYYQMFPERRGKTARG